MNIEITESPNIFEDVYSLLKDSFAEQILLGEDGDMLDMDSLVFVDLAIALESRFDIDIDNDEILSLSSVNMIVKIVRDKLGSFIVKEECVADIQPV